MGKTEMAKRYVFGGETLDGPGKMHCRFVEAVRGSEYDRIRFHSLRHSFASNLAAAGVDDRIVDKLMGHTTEAMRRRHQHLRPEKSKEATGLLRY